MGAQAVVGLTCRRHLSAESAGPRAFAMHLPRVVILAVLATVAAASPEEALINELQVKLAALEAWRAEQEKIGRKLKEALDLRVNTQGRRLEVAPTLADVVVSHASHSVALDYMWLI